MCEVCGEKSANVSASVQTLAEIILITDRVETKRYLCVSWEEVKETHSSLSNVGKKSIYIAKKIQKHHQNNI